MMVGSRSACRMHGARAPHDRWQAAPLAGLQRGGGESRAWRREKGPRQQGPHPPSSHGLGLVLRAGLPASRDHPPNPALCLLSGRSHAEARGACLIQHTPPQPLPGWCLARALRVKGHLPAHRSPTTPGRRLWGGSRGTHISVLRSRGQKTVTVTVTAPTPDPHIQTGLERCSPSPHPLLLPLPPPPAL